MKRKMFIAFFILSASSAISKLFNMISRMMLSRLLSHEAMTLYLLIIPTLSLCITIGQLGIPSAVFRLVTHPKYDNKKIVFSSIILSLFTVTIMSILLFIFAPYISNCLLKNSQSLYPILSFILFIPLVNISGILKNFLLGKDHMFVVAKAQIVEEIARLLFIYLLLKKPLFTTTVYLVTIAYLAMSVGESMSIIYMLFKINKRYQIKHPIMKHQNFIYKDILNISLPLTGSRLYHCFVNFLEPITLIYVLTRLGLDKSYIQSQYAIISGYVISILVTPTFFCNIIYRIYLPIATKDLYYHTKQTYKHLYIALFSCLLIGLPFTLIFYFFPKESLQILYNTTSGFQELKYMSIPFLLYYLQTPLSVILYAKNKNKAMFIISTLECTVEIVLTYILSHYLFIHSIIVSLFIGILITLMISAILSFKIINDTL